MIELQRQIDDINTRLNKMGRGETPLFWDGSNVGVGTNAPSLKFEVKMTGVLPAINIQEISTSVRRATMGFGVNGTTANTGWILGQSLGNNTVKDFYLLDLTAGLTRLFIDTSGNVGIGTTTPKAKLDVTDGYIRALSGTNTAPSTGTGMELVFTGGTGYMISYNRATSAFQPMQIDGSSLIINGSSTGNVGIGVIPTRKVSINDTSNSYLSFNIAGGERWVIGAEATRFFVYDSVGAQYRFAIGTDANVRIQNALYIGNIATTPSFQIHLSADSSGKPLTNTWTVSSDKRSKKDIKPFDHGLKDLLEFPLPVSFKYNGLYGTPTDDKEGIGYIAQDVLEVAPKMVITEMRKRTEKSRKETEYYSINTGAMQMMFHKSIIELHEMIITLQKEVDLLKSIS